jgi:hypothetical protein
MAQAVSRRPLKVDARVRSQVSPCEICSGQNGTGTGLSPSTSVFLCLYDSTNAPYSSSSTRCSYQKGKRAMPGNRSKSNVHLEIWEHWIETKFHFFALKGFDDETSRYFIQVGSYCTQSIITSFSGYQPLYNRVKMHPTLRTPDLSSSLYLIW